MIFDTHAHYDDDWFDGDREALLRGLSARGVGTVVNVGASMRGSRASVALSEQYPFVYASVGVHPDDAEKMTEEDMAELRTLAGASKVVAVGEIGLDYGFDEETSEEERTRLKELQHVWFRRQLALAAELALPVIIHSRGAEGDTLAVMREYAESFRGTAANAHRTFKGGIIHCFSGSPETAAEYRKLGFHVGVGGVLTFKNAKRLPDVVASAPLSQIVLETDAPYMAPVPFRGKRNDSGYLPYVVAKIAEIKGIPEEEVIRVTAANASALFSLDTSSGEQAQSCPEKERDDPGEKR